MVEEDLKEDAVDVAHKFGCNETTNPMTIALNGSLRNQAVATAFRALNRP